MFFEHFPKILYKIDEKNDGNESLITLTDIFRRVAPKDSFIVNEAFLEEYTIKSGERPEDISFFLYNNAKYHWVILLINNIIDPYLEWYYTEEQLEALVEKKYGAGNANATHHFALYDSPLICSDYNAALITAGEMFEVTHLEHERFENDSRQTIKVLQPRYLNDFITEFKQLINE